MAQQVRVEMVDDLDGGVASQTVPFSLDGVSYEIDLSNANADELRDALARYLSASRRVGGRKIRLAAGQSAGTSAPAGTSASTATAADRERSRAIRAWAVENGFTVSDRGRIAAEIVQAYHEHDGQPIVVEKTPRKRAPRKKVAAAQAR